MQTRNTLLSLVFCALLVLFSGTCYAETMYSVTESELTQLDSNLAQLATNNQQLSKELMQSQKDLATVQGKLVSLQETLLTLQNTSKETKEHLVIAQTSLQTANESLATYEAGVKGELRSLKLQRDVTLVALAYMVFKK